MINASEHVYDDDPFSGHPDVRIRLAGASYFFLGNGLIQAAVQWAPEGEGSPLGLLVMDPDRFRKKRESLTLDPDTGLRTTALRIVCSRCSDTARPDTLTVAWTEHEGVPAVEARWSWRAGEVRELFFCPDRATPRLVRQVTITREDSASIEETVRIVTGGGRFGRLEVPLSGALAEQVSFVYELDASREAVLVRCCREAIAVDPRAATRHGSLAQVQFRHELVDRLWNCSRLQMSAALSATGHVDASIWQYNREWVRDQSAVALAFLQMGDREHAACILRRLLRDFVTPEGSAMDSSEVRAADEAELDQNGLLLYTLQQYVLWTGDLELVRSNWARLAALAEFPLRPEFATPSGLLANRREYWERHRIHGIEKGSELLYQVYPAMGLAAAGELADRLGYKDQGGRWAAAARGLRDAALAEKGGMVEDGVLIKRRGVDGRPQREISPLAESGLPPLVPLGGPGPHMLDPDSCTALPIVLGFVPPDSALAARTLDLLEILWNQDWTTGGHGRYHVSSEPDSPGGWPIASLFAARAAVDAGRPDTAWRVLRWLDAVPGAAAGSWFEFYGPRIAPPAPQVGILPWNWAELITLLVQHVIGLRPTPDPGCPQLLLQPRLLPGLEHVSADIPVGSGRLHLELTRDSSRTKPWSRVAVDGTVVREAAESPVSVPTGARDVSIEVALPRE